MFSKKQVGPPQSHRLPARTAVSASPGFSILGADTAITGDITAGSDLHIDGKIDGDITCSSLIQGETSEINGSVKVGSARLAGIVRGSIDARELVVLKTAEIHGDVHYDALTIEPGAKVEGSFSTRTLDLVEPSLDERSSEPLLTLASA